MKYLGIILSAILLIFAAYTFAPERVFAFGGGGNPQNGGGGGGGVNFPVSSNLLGTNSSAQPINLSALTLLETTAPTGIAGYDILYPDSSAHVWKVINNNGTAAQMVISGTDINTANQVTVTHLTNPLPLAQGGTNCGNPTVFASLPGSPTNGYLCSVTDAGSCTCGTAVTVGGGSVKCDLTYNGTNWMPCGGAAASATGGFSTAGTGLTSAGATVSLVTPVTVANGGRQCGAPVAFASLPGSPTNGMVCDVTDAPNCYVGLAVSAGGGSTKCQIKYDGTSWFPAGGALNGVSGGPIRVTAPIATTPTLGQIYPTAMADTVNFPANFAASGIDPASKVGKCRVNPTVTEAYQATCFSGSDTYIGGVIIPPAGAGSASFFTGNVPFVRAFTTATPGSTGGNISVPTGVQNNDILVLLVASLESCQAVTGFTLEHSYNGFDGDFNCTYLRLASGDSGGVYSVAGSFPGIAMLDVVGAPTSLGSVIDSETDATGDSTTPSLPAVPASSTLSTSQDLYISFLLSHNDGVAFTAPTGQATVANLPFTLGTNLGLYSSFLNLAANTQAANTTGSYASATFWQANGIAIAPASSGGTVSCAPGNVVNIIAPSAVAATSVCPITLAGHAS